MGGRLVTIFSHQIPDFGSNSTAKRWRYEFGGVEISGFVKPNREYWEARIDEAYGHGLVRAQWVHTISIRESPQAAIAEIVESFTKYELERKEEIDPLSKPVYAASIQAARYLRESVSRELTQCRHDGFVGYLYVLFASLTSLETKTEDGLRVDTGKLDVHFHRVASTESNSTLVKISARLPRVAKYKVGEW